MCLSDSDFFSIYLENAKRDMEYCVFRSQWKFAVPCAYINRVFFLHRFNLFSEFFFRIQSYHCSILFPCSLFWISVLFIISMYFPVYSHSTHFIPCIEKRTKKQDRKRNGKKKGREREKVSEREKGNGMELEERRTGGKKSELA